MYGHHIVEDLNHLLSVHKDIDLMYKDSITHAVDEVKDAQHFYLGEYKEFVEPLKNYNKEKDPIFLGCCSENVRLPYKQCLFLFENKSDIPNDPTEVPKRGVYVRELLPDFFGIIIINYIKQVQRWVLSPQQYMVSIGKTFNDSPMKPMLEEILRRNGVAANEFTSRLNSNIQAVPTMSNTESGFSEGIAADDQRDIFVLNSALLLLNCKNIELEEIIPPKQLNKKRKKLGKQEIFTYKTLKLSLPSQNAKRSTEISESGSKSRIHLCRGHFKYYKESAPLLGKHTGMYWFQPHIRGNNKSGVVIKSYELSTKTTN